MAVVSASRLPIAGASCPRGQIRFQISKTAFQGGRALTPSTAVLCDQPPGQHSHAVFDIGFPIDTDTGF